MLTDALRRGMAGGTLPSDEQLEAFVAGFRPRSFEARETVVRAGTSPTWFGFVRTGLLRMYYLRPNGRSFTKSFILAGQFFGASDTLLGGAPTRLWIEALERTEVLQAPYTTVTEHYPRHPAWERIGRRFAEGLYMRKLEREASLLMDTAAERYDAFLRDHGAIENRIPDYHIASYLGITPETLSRLKKSRRGPSAAAAAP
jgi:CRP-like cAMP-binding protein